MTLRRVGLVRWSPFSSTFITGVGGTCWPQQGGVTLWQHIFFMAWNSGPTCWKVYARLCAQGLYSVHARTVWQNWFAWTRLEHVAAQVKVLSSPLLNMSGRTVESTGPKHVGISPSGSGPEQKRWVSAHFEAPAVTKTIII